MNHQKKIPSKLAKKNQISHEKMQSSPSHLSLIELSKVILKKYMSYVFVNIRNYLKDCEQSAILFKEEFPFLFSPSFTQVRYNLQVQCYIVDNSRSGGEGEKATNYSNYTIALSHSLTVSFLFSSVIINKSRFVEYQRRLHSSQTKRG